MLRAPRRHPGGRAARRAPARRVARLRLAVPRTLALDGLDAHVAAFFQATLTRLSAAGVLVQEIDIPAFARIAAIMPRAA